MFNSKFWNYRRGDIYLADLGEHHGHIQGETRPVVVIQNDYGNRFAPSLIVVPLTTEIKKTYQPTHYVLKHQRGLDKPCMALSEQIHTISKSQIIRYLAHVRAIHMACINLCLRESIGLPPQRIIHIIPDNLKRSDSRE